MGQPEQVAEYSALGCILMDAPKCAAVFDILLPEMFADPDMEALYSACVALRERGKSVDAVTVAEAVGLDSRNTIAKCAQTAVRISHAEEYAEIVRENWRKRETQKQLMELAYRMDEQGMTMHRILPDMERLTDWQRDIEGKIENATAKEMKSCLAEWLALMQSPPNALHTGYEALDRITGGFERGGVYVLAARPGDGKTDFALNLALRMSREYRVTYHSLELLRTQCTQRLVANVAKVNEYLLRERKLSDIDHMNIVQATELIHSSKLVIDERPFTSHADIKSSILKTRPDLIIVDHLLLMDKQLKGNQKDFEGISKVMKSLKAMAKRYNVVVLAVGQALRELDKSGKAPTMSDIYGGSAIDQDADGVCFIRVDKSKGWISGEEYWPAKLVWVKNRYGGLGELYFQYSPQYHRFVSEAMGDLPENTFVEIEDDGSLPF